MGEALFAPFDADQMAFLRQIMAHGDVEGQRDISLCCACCGKRIVGMSAYTVGLSVGEAVAFWVPRLSGTGLRWRAGQLICGECDEGDSPEEEGE